jgi:hypothetical protein
VSSSARAVLPISEEMIQGAVSYEYGPDWLRPWRLPFHELALYPAPNDTLVERAAAAAGVRLRLRTDARELSLACPPLAEVERTFDLTLANEIHQSRPLPAGEETVTFSDLPAGEKVVELWLDQAHPVAVRSLAVNEGAFCLPAPDTRRRWVTYGSSISHCRSAAGPARTWPATAARLRDLHLTCLGYGGNCHLEPMVALMIRDLPADVITLKVGINIMGQGSLGPRTFKAAVIGFVRIIREKHPFTPIGVISPIVSPPRESSANAAGLSLEAMRDEIEDAVGRLVESGNDTNLYYVNGLEIFGADLVEEYLPDHLHPNAEGYEIMGRRVAEQVLPRLGF